MREFECVVSNIGRTCVALDAFRRGVRWYSMRWKHDSFRRLVLTKFEVILLGVVIWENTCVVVANALTLYFHWQKGSVLAYWSWCGSWRRQRSVFCGSGPSNCEGTGCVDRLWSFGVGIWVFRKQRGRNMQSTSEHVGGVQPIKYRVDRRRSGNPDGRT